MCFTDPDNSLDKLRQLIAANFTLFPFAESCGGPSACAIDRLRGTANAHTPSVADQAIGISG